MDVKFYYDGIRRTLWSIEVFSIEDQSPARDDFFDQFPVLPRRELRRMPYRQRTRLLRLFLQKYETLYGEEISARLEEWQKLWQSHRPAVEEILSDVFGLDVANYFNEIHAYMTFHPCCPRFLAQESFYLNFKTPLPEILGIIIHEVTHFVWFLVWQRHFGDDSCEYESPYLKWILSEMVIPLIWNSERLATDYPALLAALDPERPVPYYRCFDGMSIDNWPILQELAPDCMPGQMTAFMEILLEYGRAFEPEIRRQMGVEFPDAVTIDDPVAAE